MSAAKVLAAALALRLLALPSYAATLSPEDAASHIDQSATVCGVVVSTKFDAHLDRRPTFLDFGKPYPDEVFAALIFGADRAKFGTPETSLQGKRVCVSARSASIRASPRSSSRNPRQLTQ
jgi:hypothetical protein